MTAIQGTGREVVVEAGGGVLYGRLLGLDDNIRNEDHLLVLVTSSDYRSGIAVKSYPTADVELLA